MYFWNQDKKVNLWVYLEILVAGKKIYKQYLVCVSCPPSKTLISADDVFL